MFILNDTSSKKRLQFFIFFLEEFSLSVFKSSRILIVGGDIIEAIVVGISYFHQDSMTISNKQQQEFPSVVYSRQTILLINY